MPRQWAILNDFSGGYVDAISAKKIRPKDLTKAQGVRLDTPAGEITQLGGSATNASIPKYATATLAPGFGLFHFSTDHVSGAAAAETGENWIAVIATMSVENIRLLLWDQTASTWATASQFGSTVGVKGVFDFVDETLRVSDSAFGANNHPLWYGYIEASQFAGLGAATQVDLDNWYAQAPSLTAPTDAGVGDTYPTAGVGLDIKFTSGAADTGSWPNKTFQIALSFIYDGNQESLLYVPSGTNTFAPNANSKISLEVHANDNVAYSVRLTGARFYCRESGTDDPWTLLADVSMKDGARSTLEGDWAAWANVAANQIKTASFDSEGENIETYEILNGFSSEEPKITISGNGEGWATSTISNRRRFVANVSTVKEVAGRAVRQRDRIYYSPVNRFDTFPRSFFIDVVRGDAEEYIKLESFADRLLAFKQRTLYVVNISSTSPANWFMESAFPHMGVNLPSAVVKTNFGVAWVNENGCFFYNGQSIRDLTENKIAPKTWSDFITNNSTIGFYPLNRRLVILKDCSGSSAGDVYIYNFNEENWTTGDSVFNDSKAFTNFITDWSGNLLVGRQATAGTLSVKKWAETGTPNVNIDVRTHEMDFGHPAIKKRIHGVTISYKSGNLHTTPISYSVDGGANFTNFTGNLADTSNAWDILKIKPTFFNCDNLMLKVATGAATGTVMIRDISIEYRPIHKRSS